LLHISLSLSLSFSAGNSTDQMGPASCGNVGSLPPLAWGPGLSKINETQKRKKKKKRRRNRYSLVEEISIQVASQRTRGRRILLLGVVPHQNLSNHYGKGSTSANPSRTALPYVLLWLYVMSTFHAENCSFIISSPSPSPSPTHSPPHTFSTLPRWIPIFSSLRGGGFSQVLGLLSKFVPFLVPPLFIGHKLIFLDICSKDS
jgi:hypothetical protein